MEASWGLISRPRPTGEQSPAGRGDRGGKAQRGAGVWSPHPGFICSASLPGGGGGTASLATVFSWAVADQDACAPHHRARAMALSSPVRSSQESASLVETRRTDPGGLRLLRPRAAGRPLPSPCLTFPPLCDLLCHLFSKAPFLCLFFTVNFWFLQPNNPCSKIRTRSGTHEKPVGMCELLGRGVHDSTRPKSVGLWFPLFNRTEDTSGTQRRTADHVVPSGPGTTCPLEGRGSGSGRAECQGEGPGLAAVAARHWTMSRNTTGSSQTVRLKAEESSGPARGQAGRLSAARGHRTDSAETVPRG